MGNNIKVDAPLTKKMVLELGAGDCVNISGVIYAARDAAHKRMTELISQGYDLPFDICNQIIYYVGPCPSRPDTTIGSAGPTTSSRMDSYAPKLIELGLTGMIGKGLRSSQVIEAMKKHKAVYFGAIGGAGALIAESIVDSEVIAFPELGPEALRKMTVKDFPAIVIIDCYGNNLYELGRAQYRV
jgi:fumarate hydratase subunit beta